MSIRTIAMVFVRLLALAALGQATYIAAAIGVGFVQQRDVYPDTLWAERALASLAFVGSECFRISAYSLDRNFLRRLIISVAIAIPCVVVVSVALGPAFKSEDQTARDAKALFLLVVLYAYFAFVARRLLDSRTSAIETSADTAEDA